MPVEVILPKVDMDMETGRISKWFFGPDAKVSKGDVLFEIDVYGARAIKDRFPDALCIYLEAPSREVQRERLVGRGDHPERVEQRLRRAEEESAAAADLDCVLVINHDVESTVDEIVAIVSAHRDTLPEEDPR